MPKTPPRPSEIAMHLADLKRREDEYTAKWKAAPDGSDERRLYGFAVLGVDATIKKVARQLKAAKKRAGLD